MYRSSDVYNGGLFVDCLSEPNVCTVCYTWQPCTAPRASYKLNFSHHRPPSLKVSLRSSSRCVDSSDEPKDATRECPRSGARSFVKSPQDPPARLPLVAPWQTRPGLLIYETAFRSQWRTWNACRSSQVISTTSAI